MRMKHFLFITNCQYKIHNILNTEFKQKSFLEQITKHKKLLNTYNKYLFIPTNIKY